MSTHLPGSRSRFKLLTYFLGPGFLPFLPDPFPFGVFLARDPELAVSLTAGLFTVDGTSELPGSCRIKYYKLSLVRHQIYSEKTLAL